MERKESQKEKGDGVKGRVEGEGKKQRGEREEQEKIDLMKQAKQKIEGWLLQPGNLVQTWTLIGSALVEESTRW